jgi:molybdopterin/thiamine biosynthesis adenylyltransferase
MSNRYINNEEQYYQDAFSRNIGLLTPAEQEILKNSRIAIPGMGGVGGIHLMTMARSGIGRFNIADFDIYEPVNVNRQFGATTASFGRPKLDVMKEQALTVNPYLEIRTFPDGLTSGNLDEFLKDVDVVIDGLDFFSFDMRRLLFNTARQKGIHVITAGPMGFSSALLIFAPDRGMGFDEYFNITDNMDPEEQSLSFALGLAPRPTHIKYMDFSRVDLKKKAGPSLNIACQICAGMAGTEALRILLDRKGLKPVPYYFQFDPYLMKLRKGRLYFGNKNPVQKIKMAVVKRMIAAKAGGTAARTALPEEPSCIVSDGGCIADDVKKFLVKAGIQAPSGDNAQPWKFILSDNKISVRIDPDADRSFFNVGQTASIISCGAVIENIFIACIRLGIQPEIKYHAGGMESDIGADIILNPAAPDSGKAGDFLYEAIWQRHTNRTMYTKESIPGSVLQECRDCILCFPGTKLYTLTRKQDLKKLAGIIYRIDRIRTENPALHKHLNQMIRFSPEQEQKTCDGLPLKNLEAGFAGELFLKFTRPWPVMNAMNKIGAGRMVAFHSYKTAVCSSAVMLIAVDGMKPDDLIAGGRVLQRIWLTLTALGWHVQPMAAAPLFYMRMALGKGNEFSARHLHMLESVKKEYFNLFPGLESQMGQVMLFRIGRGRPIKCLTRRRKPETFLENS